MYERVGENPDCSILMLSVSSGLSAQQDWTVTVLGPDDAAGSFAGGVSNGPQAVGVSWPSNGFSRATLWNLNNSTWIDLSPAGTVYSEALGVKDGQQVGYSYVAATRSASLWNGSAESWVNLAPPGSSDSRAFGVGNGQQVGESQSRASLWNGSADSWVNLHPTGFKSVAYATNGSIQVGYTQMVNELFHASLWSGTADSWVDLNPAGSTWSEAIGIDGDQQVGYSRFGGLEHAGYWTGSADSWVSLHPSVASASEVLGAFGGRQVGFAIINNWWRAGFWNGTSDSFENLSVYLPQNFGDSEATGIWSDENYIYVSGWADNYSTGLGSAILWRKPLYNIAVPTSFNLIRGQLVSGNLDDVTQSDDSYLVCTAGITLNSNEPPVWIEFESSSPTGALSNLSVILEANANTANLLQTIQLYNFQTKQFESVDSRHATLIDSVAEVPLGGDLSRFVETGTGAIKARVGWKAQGPLLLFPWMIRIDQFTWRVFP